MKKSKLKVEVFFPFGACACSYAPLMEKVGRITSNHKDTVEVKMRSTASKEALEYAVQDLCVIVDDTIRLSADFDEKQLQEAIVRKLCK